MWSGAGEHVDDTRLSKVDLRVVIHDIYDPVCALLGDGREEFSASRRHFAKATLADRYAGLAGEDDAYARKANGPPAGRATTARHGSGRTTTRPASSGGACAGAETPEFPFRRADPFALAL